MRNQFYFTLICITILSIKISFSQCVTDLNFNEGWKSFGSDTQWSVVDDTIVQLLDEVLPIDPIFFVSLEDLQNATIKGRFEVTSEFNTEGGDFIGFVMGYNAPLGGSYKYNFVLFDWKAESGFYDPIGQTIYAREGMKVSRVNLNTSHSSVPKYFWGHTEEPGFSVLSRVNSLGWEYDREYEFELTYTSTKLVIKIDGITYFDLDGCFPNGRFGFYCYSQTNARFEGFDYKMAVDFSASSYEICAGETVDFSAYNTECGDEYVNLTEWIWDFGDGNTSNQMNPEHTFTEAGLYNVRFKVKDLFSCEDSTERQILVKPIPDAEIIGDTIIPFNQSALFEVSEDLDFAYWNGTEHSYTYLVENLRTDTLLHVIIETDGCENEIRKLIRVGAIPDFIMPNAYKPGSIINPVFKPVTQSSEKFKMLILNRWGRLLFETDNINEGWDGTMNNGSEPCPAGVYVWKIIYDTFNEQYEMIEKIQQGTVTLIR